MWRVLLCVYRSRCGAAALKQHSEYHVSNAEVRKTPQPTTHHLRSVVGCADSTNRNPSTSVVSVSVPPCRPGPPAPSAPPPPAAPPLVLPVPPLRCRKERSRGPSRRMTSRNPSHWRGEAQGAGYPMHTQRASMSNEESAVARGPKSGGWRAGGRVRVCGIQTGGFQP